MKLIVLLSLLPLALCQQPYGLSQLDNYARLLNNENLGGLGHYQKALANGQIRGWEDLENKPKLSGLPPLPMTHEEVVHQLTFTQAAPVTKGTARPTLPPTNPPPIIVGPYHVNPIPELPPTPEDKQRGKYDDDGNFVPEKQEEKRQPTNNKIQGTKIHDFNEKKKDDIEDYEPEDFYDDPELHIAPKAPAPHHVATHKQPKVVVPVLNKQAAPKNPAQGQRTAPNLRQPQGGPVTTSQQKLPPVGRVQPHKIRARPVLRKKYPKRKGPRPDQLFREQVTPRRVVTTVRTSTMAPSTPRTQRPTTVQQIQLPVQTNPPPTLPPTPPPQRFPVFVYRPKPKALDREEYFNNVLQEVEEYDDFLEQQRGYQEQFPAAPLHNPYAHLHPGQLLPPIYQRGVAIDNTGFVKPLENQPFIATVDAKQNPNGVPAQQQSANQQGLVPLQPTQQPQQQVFGQQQQLPQMPEHNLFPHHDFGNLPSLEQLLHPEQNNMFPATATEHPLMNLFKIFEFPHQSARIHAAPLLNLEGNGKTNLPLSPTPASVAPPNFSSSLFSQHFLPPLNPFQLVNIKQQPVNSPLETAGQTMEPNLG